MQRDGARDWGLLIIRLAGLYLAFGHGLGKLVPLATGAGDSWIAAVESLGFPMPIAFAWASALAETIGGLCLAFGLYTRTAAFFVAFNMGVAALVRHRAAVHFLGWIGLASPTAEELQAAGNPERAILYLLIAIGLLILGGGNLSLDTRLQQRRRR